MSSLNRVGPPDVTLPEEAEEGTRQMPKWPTECISEKISMQATGCTEGLHFQRYPREIPHESERKTMDDEREGCGVLNSLC